MSHRALVGSRTRGFAAYLGDPDAVGGVERLLRQKQLVEEAALALDGRITRWGVDSGRRFPGQRCGTAVLRMLGDLRRGETLLVEDLGVLGADRDAVEVVAGTFEMLGVAVVAARALLAPETHAISADRRRRDRAQKVRAGALERAP